MCISATCMSTNATLLNSWVACDVTSVLIRHGVVHMEVKQQRPRADLEARR